MVAPLMMATGPAMAAAGKIGAGAAAGSAAAGALKILGPTLLGGMFGMGSSMLSGRGGSQSGLHEDDWVLWKKNYDMQKEFAKRGVRWRVEDAKAAGLHPLAAMGVNPAQGSPIHLGSSQGHKQGKDMSWLARMGQDISRSARATMDPLERRLRTAQVVKAEEEARMTTYHRKSLEDQLNNQNQVGMPTSNLGIVENNLAPDQNHVPGKLYQRQSLPTSYAPGVKEGVGPEGNYKHTRGGYIKYYPDQEAMDLISESIPAAFSWWSDMVKYKWVMTSGSLFPDKKRKGKADKAHYKRYLQEKAKVEKWAGEPVYWDHDNITGFKWRLKRYKGGGKHGAQKKRSSQSSWKKKSSSSGW